MKISVCVREGERERERERERGHTCNTSHDFVFRGGGEALETDFQFCQ